MTWRDVGFFMAGVVTAMVIRKCIDMAWENNKQINMEIANEWFS